jgi:hypothetical protein
VFDQRRSQAVVLATAAPATDNLKHGEDDRAIPVSLPRPVYREVDSRSVSRRVDAIISDLIAPDPVRRDQFLSIERRWHGGRRFYVALARPQPRPRFRRRPSPA